MNAMIPHVVLSFTKNNVNRRAIVVEIRPVKSPKSRQ